MNIILVRTYPLLWALSVLYLTKNTGDTALTPRGIVRSAPDSEDVL